MLRPALSVIAGFLAWTLLWIVGSILVVAIAELDIEAGRIDATIPLVVLIGISILCSVVSGATCALVNRRHAGTPVWVLACALLVVGLAVELSSWGAYPVWYHLVFLVLLIPATKAGAAITAKPTPAS